MIRRPRLVILLPLLVVLGPGVARADQVDDYIKKRMAEFHLRGVSLVVIKDGEIVKSAGYGFADSDRQIPATPDTVYKIGSVSKQFVASGIMLLVQEKRLTLDDPVSKFFVGTPAAWQPITIRHLLTHTAGLVRESPAFDPNKIQPDADLIKAAYGVPLRFAPGTKWEYSNLGYFMLAEIIGKVIGKPWNDYMNEKVFRVAGMKVTAPTNVQPTLPNRAIGYSGRDNSTTAPDWRALRPSGAYLSTVLDLAKWDALLHSDKILTASTRQQMWTPVSLNDGQTAPYGLGWHVDSLNGRRRIWHGGGMPGFVSHFVRYVDAGLSVVVLTNGDDVDMPAIANDVAAFYFQPSTSAGPRSADSHVAAAREAAGNDYKALFDRLCTPTPTPPPRTATPAPTASRGAAASSARPAIPERATWYAEPVKVFDNLYFVGTREHSAWAVVTTAGIIIIDPLYAYAVEDEVVGGLKKVGLNPADIKYVLVSHGHGDHSGGAGYLQDRFNARVILGGPDWDLLERNTRDTSKPKRDMVATDGQQLTLGDTTLTLHLTPGHTLGTFSTLIPVRDGTRTHMAALWGGTAFNFQQTPNNYELYIASAEKFGAIAAKAGVEIILSNHTAFDGSTTKLPAVLTRQSGAPHPYVSGADAVKRYFTVASECAKAGLARLPR